MIRAFVFDLSALVKLDQVAADAYARAAGELGGEAVATKEVRDAYAEVVGQPRYEVASYLVDYFELGEAASARAADLGVDSPWEALAALQRQHRDEMLRDRNLIRRMQWADNRVLLDYARQLGCRTALTSALPRDAVDIVLTATELAGAFDFVATDDDVAHTEPDPEMFTLVADSLGFAPAEHLVVAASASAVQAAQLAGMHVIAITGPFSRAEIHRQGLVADEFIIDDSHQLMHAIMSIYDAERSQPPSSKPSAEQALGASGPFPPMDARLMPWVDVEELQRADKVAPEKFNITVLQMVELTGEAIADTIAAYAPPGEVVVLAGGGNNGASGLCAARYIAARGRFVRVVLAKPAERLNDACEHHLATLRAMGMEPLTEAPDSARVVVDALVGYGLHGPLSGRVAELADWATSRWTVAVDYPSGFGYEGAIRADVTVTLSLPKRGLESLDRLLVADTGLPEELWTSIGVKAGRPFVRGRILEIVGLDQLRAELESLEPNGHPANRS